jgi:hypothetical protein
VVENINGSVACEDADGTCHLFPFGEMPRVCSNFARYRAIIS